MSLHNLTAPHSQTFYIPRIKERGFLPNPTAKYGIPLYADSVNNPRCIDTLDHDLWWEEEIDRLMNGYTTGGVWIPPALYFWLNYCYITTVGRGLHLPDFVDAQLEYEEFILDIKARKRGAVVFKGRRRGVSEYGGKRIDHNMRFLTRTYKAGICAGLEVYSEGFYQKFEENNKNLPPELRMHYLKETFEETKTGWEEKTSSGFIEKGEGSKLMCRTMFNNPNMFKGELLDDCIFEEAGEFKLLLRGYSATKACFQVGQRMVGTPFVQGTGGKISSSSAEFKEIWYDHDAYNLDRFSLYGDRILISFFIGSTNEEGKVEENCPNIRALQKEKGYTDEQILGCEDTAHATDRILARRSELIKAKNKEIYFEFFLDNPLNEREGFLRFTGNDFDPEAIATQRNYLANRPPLYNDYLLDWDKDIDGKFIMPYKVIAVPYDENNPLHKKREGEVVWIRYMPELKFKNLDVGGGDSYDQDKARQSKSLGAFVVLRRKGHNHKDDKGNSTGHKRIPVCLYRNRPARKEIFYDTCAKISVFYGLYHNTLFDASKPMVINYYETMGLKNYLAERPQSFESIHSEQTHKYGVLLTSTTGGRGSKNQMISLVQTWVIDELDECVFPHIVEGLSEYDVEQKDSDWDEVDATGIAIMRDIDMKVKPKPRDEKEVNNRFNLPEWEMVNGTLQRKYEYNVNPGEPTDADIKDPFMQMIRSGHFQENE